MIERLMAAMDACAIARGEAQWTNGYRAAAFAGAIDNTPEGERLYQKEQAQWREVGRRERAFRRLAQRLLREAADGSR